MFETSGDDERNNRAEAAEHDTESLIDAIHTAACNYLVSHDLPETYRNLSKAIDRAMYHAYSEGRADERREWIEKAMRAMNETGQGEHGVTRAKDERPNQAHRHD